MLLGKVKAPATGEAVTDLPRVQLLIQQLEMLEKNAAKLSINEQQMLKQSLQHPLPSRLPRLPPQPSRPPMMKMTRKRRPAASGL